MMLRENGPCYHSSFSSGILQFQDVLSLDSMLEHPRMVKYCQRKKYGSLLRLSHLTGGVHLGELTKAADRQVLL